MNTIRKKLSAGTTASLKPGAATRHPAVWEIVSPRGKVIGHILRGCEVSRFDENGIERPYRRCGSHRDARTLAYRLEG